MTEGRGHQDHLEAKEGGLRGLETGIERFRVVEGVAGEGGLLGAVGGVLGVGEIAILVDGLLQVVVGGEMTVGEDTELGIKLIFLSQN